MASVITDPTSVRTSRTRGQPGGLRDYISPSRLNLWLKCPLAFKLRYVAGIKMPTSPAMFLGKVVHAALEFFYKSLQPGTVPTPEDAERYLVDAWEPMAIDDAMAFASTEEEAALKQQACGLIRTYLENRLPDEPAPIAIEMAIEVPLVDPVTGEDLGIPLYGVTDLVLDEPNGALGVDFKTAARGGSMLEISHEVQLSCYAYLYRQVARRDESALEIRNLIKTKTPKVEYHRWPTREERHFRRLFAIFRAYLESLDSGRFVFRPSWSCSSCDYRDNHCRTWCG